MYFVYLLRMETRFPRAESRRREAKETEERGKVTAEEFPSSPSSPQICEYFFHTLTAADTLSSIVDSFPQNFLFYRCLSNPMNQYASSMLMKHYGGSDMKHCTCEEKTSSTSKWWTRNLCGGLSLNESLSRKQQILWRVAVLPATSLQDPLTLSLIIQDSFMAEKLKKLRLWIQIFQWKKQKIHFSHFFHRQWWLRRRQWWQRCSKPGPVPVARLICARPNRHGWHGQHGSASQRSHSIGRIHGKFGGHCLYHERIRGNTTWWQQMDGEHMRIYEFMKQVMFTCRICWSFLKVS